MVNLEQAKRLVAAFAAEGNEMQSPKGWKVSRADLARQMRVRLSGARDSYPDQKNTSRCGPAAFLYCLLKDRPDLYVRYAIGLWTDGTFNLRNGQAGKDLVVAPGRGTMDSMLTSGGPNDINELDWMTMGSLSAPHGSASPDQRLGAITHPDQLYGWFAAVGAPYYKQNDDNDLDSVFSSGEGGFKEIFKFWSGATWIVPEINPRMIDPKNFGMFDRHWPVVSRRISPTLDGRPLLSVMSDPKTKSIKAMRVSINFVTWGVEDLYGVAPGDTVGDILGWYFGGAAFPAIP